MSKDNLPSSELTSAKHLLKRFDEDIRSLYSHMQFLQIAFNNLQGSWLAISQVHKIVKIESEKS